MNNYDDYCTKLLGKHGCTSEDCKCCSVAKIIAKHDSELLDKFVARLEDYFVIPHDVYVIEKMAKEMKAEVTEND